jgi:tetratricopeptide (TPR) repeat protein
LGWAATPESATESNGAKFEKAKEYFGKALQLAELCGNDLERAHCLRDLGKLAQRTGDWAEMKARCREAADIYVKCDVLGEQTAALDLIKTMQATNCSFP